jgi:hypothetical protein
MPDRRFVDWRRGSSQFEGYRLIDQWTSYGWNVFHTRWPHYDQIVGVLKMDDWDPSTAGQ